MAISRRRMLQVGGVGVVAAAIPVGQHVVWNGRNFDREGLDAPVPEVPEGEQLWTNWSGTQRATPKQIAVPESDAELAEIIRNATGPVRPVGSGHSWTGLVPSEGTIVDCGRFSGLISHDKAAMTATFGAGTRLRQASRELAGVGMGFPNMPDVDVQTLGGSFATATHGTGAELAAIHDYIQSFRLVTASGDILDVSRESNPDLFLAGKASLGALGVITQYTLAAEPAFNLKRVVAVEAIEDVIAKSDAEAAKHRSFEFFYLVGTGKAVTITHNVHNGPPEGEAASNDEDAMQDLKAARDQLGWFPWLRRKMANSALPDGIIEERADESWRLLSTARPTKFNEMEYHLPLDTGLATLEEVIRRLEARKDTFFPIEVRYVAPDDAWLSPFEKEGRLSIAIHAYETEPYDYFFSEFEPLFVKNGGRPHWGKMHTRKAADLAKMYPNFGKFQALRAEIDPDGKFLNDHLREVFGVA